MKHKVHMSQSVWITVDVEVDDDHDISDTIDKARDENEFNLCVKCAGWGRGWWADASDEVEAIEVTDENGKVLWSAKEGK